MKTVDVISLFLNHKIGNALNVHSSGDKLFSYNTCIAQWLDPATLIINITKYSVTTSKHLTQLRRGRIPPPPFKVLQVKEVPLNASSLKKYLSETDQFML